MKQETPVPTASTPPLAVDRPSRFRWYVLGLFVVIYIMNVGDRLVLSVLAQSIKLDLHLSDFVVGLLIGPAVALVYAALGIPMGYVADRVHRVHFLAICLAAWSGLTALGGLAANGLQLGLTRIGVSAMEAGGSPAISSLVADYFDARERPFAMALYAAASAFGVALSFSLGGILNDHFGWRGALALAGAPGIVLGAILLATVREPIRGSRDVGRTGLAVPARRPGSMLSTLAALWRNRFYRNVIIATGISNFCFHAVLNWGPSLAIRKFNAGSGHTGVWLGIGIGLFGGIAMIVAGRVISAMAHDGMRRPLQIAACLQLCSIPLMLGALFSTRLDVCAILLALTFGFEAFFTPVYWAVSQSYVPPEMRAMAAAVMLLVAALLGAGLSAPLVGAISDLLTPHFGAASLQCALALGTPVNLLVALLCFLASRRAGYTRPNGANDQANP